MTLGMVKNLTTLPMERFEQHIIQIKWQIAEYIGIFLYGSQNYGLDYESSDVDTIVLIRAADRPKQILTFESGKAKVYTLKYFLHRLALGDLECYEILYTQYNSLNPIYENEWSKFVANVSLSLCNPRLQHSLRKKLSEHLNQVLWLQTNPDNAYYNKKRLYWAMRVMEQLERMDVEPFPQTLLYRGDGEYDLLKIKTITNHLSPKQLNDIYKRLRQALTTSREYVTYPTEEELQVFSWFYQAITTKETFL